MSSDIGGGGRGPRHAGGRGPVGVRRAPRCAAAAPRRRRRRPPDRRVRVEGPRAGDRRRRWPTVIAATLPGARVGVLSGPSFAAGDRARAARGAGGGVDRHGRSARPCRRASAAIADPRRGPLISAADLHERRRHRRVRRRRAQERHRHRRRLLRRLRLRRQRARRADHARPRRDGAAGGADGRPGAHAGGAGRAGRSGADLHRRSVAQPPGRAGARARRRAGRHRWRGSGHIAEGVGTSASRAIWRRGSASTCRSRARSRPCCTTASRRARRSAICSRATSARNVDKRHDRRSQDRLAQSDRLARRRRTSTAIGLRREM